MKQLPIHGLVYRTKAPLCEVRTVYTVQPASAPVDGEPVARET